MLASVLLLVDDPKLRGRLRALIEGPDARVTEVRAPGSDLLATIGQHESDLGIIADNLVPAGLFDRLKADPRAPELVVITREDDAEHRAQLLAAGFLAVVSAGLADDALREALGTLIGRRRESAIQVLEVEQREEPFRLGDFVTLSPRMRRFMAIARRLCATDSTVLVLGETGVGKERLARAIHSESRRAEGPFIVVNCGAIPESLLESELFGHEKGAFTGAIREHRGYFELAHRGTILLDEIGEMPLHLQVKLLRALQERSIQRIGGERAVDVDVRVMAATNRDLDAEMQAKRFRSDLFYRLSVVTLEIPPLRDRVEDIPALAENYLAQFRSQMPSTARRFHPTAVTALARYPWPGNVRELINVIERAVLLCPGEEIGLAELPDNVAAAGVSDISIAAIGGPAVELDGSWLNRSLADCRRAWTLALEREYLTGVLRETGGKIGETARRAGMDPRSLYTKMKALGLRKEDFREGQRPATGPEDAPAAP